MSKRNGFISVRPGRVTIYTISGHVCQPFYVDGRARLKIPEEEKEQEEEEEEKEEEATQIAEPSIKTRQRC